MNGAGRVSLKWTSYLMIAIIVAFLGNIDSRNLSPRIQSLQDHIDQLERKIGVLQHELEKQQ
jgi:hypothetical protein